ncbi:DNA/RNA non-specific endonuclease [Microlunatus speluncae]|uniref:DNA/RNA non-specific endonuclease n=1 Tax=Microlunatus speluncae TaxID=2594267 RepID=UPI0012668466|nr:DNA/RNA non-specific endonuclease [Microlunatus speluncae]
MSRVAEIREARIAEAADRGVSREEYERYEAADHEDGRQAGQLELARHRIRDKSVWGPPDERAARRQEHYDRQDAALEHFRTVPVEGPENRPIEPARQRDYVATGWMEHRDQPFPPGDLSRRDELVYRRYEITEQTRDPQSFHLGEAGARPDLAGTTQPTSESLRDRYPEGVSYTDNGHPDLSRYASKTVVLENGFDRPEHAEVDARANPVFGWQTTPEDKTWHKSGDGRTVLLVATELHQEYGHADQRPADGDRSGDVDHAGPHPPSQPSEDRERPDDAGPIRLSTGNPDHKDQLSKPPPDSTIVVDDRFTYTTDHLGRVTHASARLDVVDLEHPRDKSAQAQLIGKLPGDHAGHLFARIFQGPGDTINLAAMEGNKVNLGQYKSAEHAWRRGIEAGHDVKVEVALIYASDTPRPDALQLTWWIDDKRMERFIYNTPRPAESETP